MTKLTVVLASVAALGLAAPAFAADATMKTETTVDANKDGSYDKTTKASKKTPSGKVSSETESKLDVDSKGDTTKTTTTEDVNDPKGLMNKHKTKTETKEKTKDGMTKVEHMKKVDGKTVEDTKSDTSY